VCDTAQTDDAHSKVLKNLFGNKQNAVTKN
jgi:hypothetical protein